MLPKILITLGVVVFTIVVPYLEINASHVFNPLWPPHARFHEVWQLTTNCLLGGLCLWFAWIKDEIKYASIISIFVMGGVVFAHIIGNSYGGSVLSGNLSKTILGMELAVFAASLVVIMSVIAWGLEHRTNKALV